MRPFLKTRGDVQAYQETPRASSFRRFDLSQYINPLVHEKALLAIRAHSAPDNTYKTVMCQKWLETASCGFGFNCRFAHGEDELRHTNYKPRLAGNRKYKTRLCENFNNRGVCPYGRHCLFIHPDPSFMQSSFQQNMQPSPPMPLMYARGIDSQCNSWATPSMMYTDGMDSQYNLWTTPNLVYAMPHGATPSATIWAPDSGSGATGTARNCSESPPEDYRRKGRDGCRGFFADALSAIAIKFVESADEIETAIGLEIDFAHQHFGESEKIFGYKDLSVFVCYSSCSLFVYPQIKYKSRVPDDSNADDIICKMRDQLPTDQLNALIVDLPSFQAKLNEQSNFKPFGFMVGKFHFVDFFDNTEKEIQVYKIEQKDATDEDVRYIQRAQSLALWYIDAAEYTDKDDSRFFHYIAFEVDKWNDGAPKYKFAGYSSLYRFYCYPDKNRVRIAHMLLAPPYLHAGNGIKLLNAIYADLRCDNEVYDITVESPAENFLMMRDCADVTNCFDLPEYSKDEVMKGFSKKMELAAREKLKLFKRQARRVYEIIRLHHVGTDQSSLAAYKVEIGKRIVKPLLKKNSGRNLGMLSRSLSDSEMSIACHNLGPTQHKQFVEDQYRNVLENYMDVLQRLKKYEPKFLR